jgi:hypothetical protein
MKTTEFGSAIYVVSNSDNGTPLNCEIARGLIKDLKLPFKENKIITPETNTDNKQEDLSGYYMFDDKHIIIEDHGSGLYRRYSETLCELIPLSSNGTKFVNSQTGQLYIFDVLSCSLSITDINGSEFKGKKGDSEPEKELDDRIYNTVDPAKLVNLQIRDLLDLNENVSKKLDGLVSK